MKCVTVLSTLELFFSAKVPIKCKDEMWQGVGGGKKDHLKRATESRTSLRPCLKVAAKVSNVDLVTTTPLETPEEELAQMSDVVDLATTSSPELVDMLVTPTPSETPEELSQATLIWRAVKLPIYTVALVPLTVSESRMFSFCIFEGMVFSLNSFPFRLAKCCTTSI